MQKIKKIITYASVGLFLPVIALAQTGLNQPKPPAGLGMLGTQMSFSELALFIINIFLGVVGLIAVVFLVYGGFRYITSAGNDEVAGEAKKTIQNAIIGLVVVIISYVIVTIIIKALSQNIV